MKGGGGGLSTALVIIMVGSVLAYSGFTNTPVTDLFAGVRGKRSRPAPTASPATGDVDTSGRFKGPHAKVLAALADVATARFNLRIGDTCRPQNATYGAKNSLHKSCRAFDASGRAADMIAFTRYADANYGHILDELFHTPAGPKFAYPDHTDHVHVGA